MLRVEFVGFSTKKCFNEKGTLAIILTGWDGAVHLPNFLRL